MTTPSSLEELREWAKKLGWRWDESCKWFAIDLHEDGGGPLTTVLNEKAMQLFYDTFRSHMEAVIKEHDEIEHFMIASDVLTTMTPLLFHRLEDGFPSMTKEVIEQTHAKVKNYMKPYEEQRSKSYLEGEK